MFAFGVIVENFEVFEKDIFPPMAKLFYTLI